MIENFAVKVCGITNEADLGVAVEAGANAIGFNFYKRSPRYIDPLDAEKLARFGGGDYLRVAVFVHPSSKELEDSPFEIVQIHGRMPQTIPSRLRLWRAIAPSPQPPFEAHKAEAYLMDTPSASFGGSGKAFDWRVAAGFPAPFIVAGGLDGSNVADAIRAARPWGVDACSRLESSPGKKEARLVREFITNALNGALSLEKEPVGISI